MSASAARSATTPPGFESDLGEDRLRPIGDGRANPVEVVDVDERRGPAEPLEHVPQLRQRAAVQLPRRDDVVARLEQRVEREQLGGVARRDRDGAAPAFERGDLLLERRDGGVRDPRVDVAERLEVEQRGRVVDVVEHVGRRLVDRHVAGAGGRVGRGAGVDRAGLEAEVELEPPASSASGSPGPVHVPFRSNGSLTPGSSAAGWSRCRC